MNVLIDLLKAFVRALLLKSKHVWLRSTALDLDFDVIIVGVKHGIAISVHNAEWMVTSCASKGALAV
jgi:hypothetical protein